MTSKDNKIDIQTAIANAKELLAKVNTAAESCRTSITLQINQFKDTPQALKLAQDLKNLDVGLEPIKQKLEPQLSNLALQIQGIKDLAQLKQTQIELLGRERGVVTAALTSLKYLPPDVRKLSGLALNPLKTALEQEFADKETAIDATSGGKTEQVDFSLPGRRPPKGHLHPITQITNEITDIFAELGYQIATGPDIETDYYNFDALNTPADHPARDSHDTFYVAPGTVLRTHTTPVQIRVMEKVKPPVAIIMPGRVYRVDYDATHSPMFNQLDGVLVDQGVTFADLKGTLYHFLHRMFGKNITIRFRPHFFPFTEPSAEVDLLWTSRDPSTGATRTKWMEVLGCGMVHPGILKRVGYDSEKYSGFAFGLGLDRIAMARHSIPNIHYMFENDLRVLEQF